MNAKYNMIIIKGEIKTREIISCQYNRDTKKWDVEFNNGKIYSYKYYLCPSILHEQTTAKARSKLVG